MASFFCKAKFQMDGNLADEVESQIIDLGIHPEFGKNGTKPVLSNQAKLIANSMAGNFATQSF